MKPTTSPALRRKLLSLSIAAALAVSLAACGSDDDNGALAPPASTESTAVATTIPGMRAPVPVQVASGSSGAGTAIAGRSSAESASNDMGADMSMIAPYFISEFILGEGFPALPTNNVGFVFDGATAPTDEQIAALAAAFGVEGEVVYTDQDGFKSWQVGPNDGTAPTIFVSGDAQASWSFNPAWAEGGDAPVSCVYVDPAVTSTGTADATSTDTGTDIVEPAVVEPSAGTDAAVPQEICDEPEPPANVPTAGAAEAQAVEQLTSLGVDVSTLTFDTYADEWSASVTATVNRNGSSTGQIFSFGFGAEGALQWAGGSLATPVEVGPYDLIDIDTALARLVEMNAWQGTSYPTDMLARDNVGVTDVVTQTEAGTVSAGSAVGGSEGPAGSDPGSLPIEPQVEPVPPETMPVETLPIDSFPVETFPAPEARTVTLVDVEADVWWAWDVDNVLWLLPAYRFIDTDGGWHVVPAVTDEFLIEVEQPVMKAEPPAEPTEPAALDIASLESLVGLPIEEFAKEAEAMGASVRVTEIDGQPQAVTMDYQFDRVNVAVTTTDGVQIVTALSGLG